MERNRFLTIAGLAVLLFALVPAAAGRQVLAGHVPQAVSSSQALSALSPTTQLHLAIGLPLRNQAELDSLLDELADPGSPNYRQYLTPEQFAARFAPSEQDYQALIQFAQESGLTVTGTHANRMLLDVSGAVRVIENALHVKMLSYRHPLRGQFFAPDREPSLDAETPVLNIAGLTNFVVPKPMGLKSAPLSQASPLVTGSGPYGLFAGKDFRAAYAPGVTLTGNGQSVGLLEFDGFYAADVTKNAAAAGVTAPVTQTVLLDGFNGAPGSANIEVILDIMMAAYMAPGLSKVIVYEGYYPNDVLNRMATDNLAAQLSSSWGFGIDATTEQIFKQFVAQGQSLLQASGDSGAYKSGVMTPSDDPNLTVVGGTSLSTNGAGGSWQAESTWPGSGGGISTAYPIPTYQQGFSMAACGGSTKMRNIPDVALTADIQMYLVYNNGAVTAVGGTSAAAPLWAGFIALANQQAAAAGKSRLGFLNPQLYTIGNSSNYVADFHDIKSGNNGLAAVTGYDLATGWGSPAGQHLINDLTGTTAASFTLSSSATTLSVIRGASGSAVIAINGSGGFSGSVSLSVTGLPSGVTANFSPASATTSSSLILTVSSSAVAGSYALTVKGVSGSLSATTPLTLTVPAPSFSLAASASSLAIYTGGSGDDVITVTGANGFSNAVTFAASGLPAGVTAAFSPVSSASSTKLILTVGSAVTAGSYAVRITGTAGSLSGTADISLTITTSTFTLSASMPAISAVQTASGIDSIIVTKWGNLSGNVLLAASGLPAGVTASFSPASTSTTSTLTLSTASSAKAGAYTLTVTGTSGSVQRTVSIQLTITAAVFAMAFQPASLNLVQGQSAGGVLMLNMSKGLTGPSLSASGMPSGVTASFGSWSGSNTSQVIFTASKTVTAGRSTVTIKAASSGLTASASLTLIIQTPTSGTTPVNLAAAYNIQALAIDGLAFSGGGLDGAVTGASTAYSANLIGSTLAVTGGSVAGTIYAFGPANALSGVSSKAMALPAGQFVSLKVLAAAVNGNQAAQIFKVTYADGSATSFNQNVSDWSVPQNYSGEVKALPMAWRDTAAGQYDVRTFYLYQYTFTLNSSKTVASFTLPSNRNVVLLAATLVGK